MDFVSTESLQGLIQQMSAWGLKVLGGLALLIAGLLVARVIRSATTGTLRRSGLLDPGLVHFLGRLVYYGVVSLILISVLGIVGIETASLITVLAASSLAIGLALQGSLSNFASGVMLLVFRPYRPGDYVELGEYEGWVKEIGVFSTKLDTNENTRVVIPNNQVAESPVLNWSTNGTRRIDLEIEVSVNSPMSAVRQAIEAMLSEEALVLAEPAPLVAAADFGDTSVKLAVRPWCEHTRYWELRYSLPERIRAAVESAGGSLPTPQREIRLIRDELAA